MRGDIFMVTRRALLAQLGAGLLVAPAEGPAIAGTAAPRRWRARAESMALASDRPAAAVWQLDGAEPAVRIRQGEPIAIALANDLPAPCLLSVRGPFPVPQWEPLLGQTATAPAASATFTPAPASRAGTMMCDLRLLGDGAAAPSRPLAVIVDEANGPSVDRDEVFLIEDWRVATDGTLLAPGRDPGGATALHTLNGRTTTEVRVRPRERIRLRLINGCQRAVVAFKIQDTELRVLAIDSRPAEPFSARNGAVVLPPGGRSDVILDAPAAPGTTAAILLHDGTAARPLGRLVTTDEAPARAAPLPPALALASIGLPERLDLKSALRAELALGGPDWLAPSRFAASSPPAFQAKTGRTVVLAVTNRAATTSVLHLHGHPFRLLDKLDDGWKPYWLDTLALEAGQTQRIAFLAETAGRFLIESMATDWAAPRLVRWHEVK